MSPRKGRPPHMGRRFTAPPDAERCHGGVITHDESPARCMHRRRSGSMFCGQHEPPPVVVTCPFCEAAPRDIVRHTDEVGVAWWTLADRCSECMTARSEVEQ